ncbi:MAG: hypothetical protein QM286_07115 [Acidobacteriota bacterium]|nr:hypothetical protein [Acidobacteriota bacterium]
MLRRTPGAGARLPGIVYLVFSGQIFAGTAATLRWGASGAPQDAADPSAK